jgi:uncharacterized protein (DUF1015 family)
MDKSEQVGVVFPEILIPDQRTNAKKWAVVACDQFTSDKDYWISTTKMVGGSPSSLHIILPEVFLKDSDVDERIEHAKETMQHYIEDGVLVRLPRGTVLVERETAHGTRIGLMLAVDLEKYEIDPAKKPLIRATEQTVRERIPARMALREDALIECPHVMLLINDPSDTVLAPVYKARGNHTVIYDTPLMQGGGHIKGWYIDDQDILNGITDALAALKKKSSDGMLFAVGDGNHSLASAKAVWDEKKHEMSDEARQVSPLRYALVEVVNLFDHGLSMHPIHRVLFGVEAPNALRMLVSILSSMGTEPRMMYTRGLNAHSGNAPQSIIFESKMSKGRIELNKPQHDLVSVTLTKALDALLKELPRAEIDYIHGDDAFHALSREHGCLGFMMMPMKKEKLFAAVEEYGVLPRKAFSLGTAEEKRYYFECRLLVNADAKEEDAPEEDTSDMPENDVAEQTGDAVRDNAEDTSGEAAAGMTVDESVLADDDPDAPFARADRKALRKKRQRERKER